MSSLTVSNEQTASATPIAAKVIQPAWVRVVHWVNALAMVLMIMSGWQIYNASPLFGFTFSKSITLGGWLGGALLWHFAAMWLLMVNGLVYLALVRFYLFKIHHARRLARWRAAVALRRDVAFDG